MKRVCKKAHRSEKRRDESGMRNRKTEGRRWADFVLFKNMDSVFKVEI